VAEILLITVSGSDRPGLTSSFAGILADAGASLLDIGQAVIHNSLTFGLMVRVDANNVDTLTAAIEAEAGRAEVAVRVAPVTEQQYRAWIGQQQRQRFIINLLGSTITAAQLAAVTRQFVEHGLNIDLMERLSGRDAAARSNQPRMCIEFTVSGDTADAARLRQSLLSLADNEDFDIAVQEDSIFRRNRRLVVFDMDSTLIQMEVIDELARRAGVYDAVSAITASAMRGEIDFPTSFRRRMALLKGLSAQALDDVANNLPLTQGTHRLLRTLKTLGYKTAIISGGFTYFARKLQTELGFDYVYAHELEVIDGKLTGEITNGIIDGPRKAEILREIADREQIALAQTIAVGDGANDLPMLSIAGIGVAFHAKPLVRQKAQHSISLMGLDALLYLLGIRDRHVGN
jgi:phosphoserine phosphatase